MARISGVDLPREKRVEIGLTYIYGIGLTSSKDILAKTGINPDTRVKDLTEDDVAKLRDIIEGVTAYVQTAGLGHHQIQNHQIGMKRLKHLQRLLTVVSALVLIAFAAEIQAEGLVNHRIVVGNQNKRIH